MAQVMFEAPVQTGLGRLAELINGDPMRRVDADMKHVLDTLSSMGAGGLEYCTPAAARRQPRAVDAIAQIIARQRRAPVNDGIAAQDITLPGADEDLPARLYHPQGLLSRLNPLIVFFHGGGFVTGDLDSHDASARALARRTGAVVLSVGYRLAPEHRFPAAFDDAWAAWTWAAGQVTELGIDARRIVVAGEDSGATLAAHIALRARDEHHVRPVHQLLIHPIAGGTLDTPSYNTALRTRPVNTADMHWRFRQLLETPDDLFDPRIDLCARTDWQGVAPVTILLADLDPLRSEGEMLGDALEAASVPVDVRHYPGVTQGFFGLGQVVTRALFAQADAAEAISRAFAPARRS